MSEAANRTAEIVVKITDQCTVRFPSLLPADQRDAIVAKMRGIPKHRAPRAVNHPRARAAAEKHGTAVLTATPEELSTIARSMVRIYYRSMGDETLAFDAGPMTWQAADRMERECTEALTTDRYVVGEEPRLLRHARLVVLPSQSVEPVQVTEATLYLVPDLAPVEIAPVEIAPVEIAPVEIAPVEIAPVEIAPVEIAPVERSLRFYREAMARRAARLARAA